MFLVPAVLCAQEPNLIRVKKDQHSFYFFQKGPKSDTLDNHSLFYLIVPDTLKKNISVQVDNGRLLATENDSLLQFNYLYSMQYESVYSKVSNEKKARFELKTLVNGTSGMEQNVIRIRIVDRRENEILLENRYYVRRD